MPKDEVVGKKTSLPEQRILARAQEEKEFMTFGRRAGHSGEQQCFEPMKAEN